MLTYKNKRCCCNCKYWECKESFGNLDIRNKGKCHNDNNWYIESNCNCGGWEYLKTNALFGCNEFERED